MKKQKVITCTHKNKKQQPTNLWFTHTNHQINLSCHKKSSATFWARFNKLSAFVNKNSLCCQLCNFFGSSKSIKIFFLLSAVYFLGTSKSIKKFRLVHCYNTRSNRIPFFVTRCVIFCENSKINQKFRLFSGIFFRSSQISQKFSLISGIIF